MSEIKNKRQAAQVLARIIAENPQQVRDALFESGVDISPKATDKEVVKSIVTNIGRNRMLQDEIGKLATNREFFSTNGNTDGGFFSNPQNTQAIGNVVGQALGFWLGSRREKQQAEAAEEQMKQQIALAEINADLVEKQLALEQARLGQEPQGLSRGAKIGIGLGVVAIIGLTIFLVMRKKK